MPTPIRYIYIGMMQSHFYGWQSGFVVPTRVAKNARMPLSRPGPKGDANLCLALKYGFLAGYKEKLWSKSHQAREDLLWKIRNHLDEGAITRRRQSRASGGVVQPEAPGCTDTDYKKIDDSAFSMLRKELGE